MESNFVEILKSSCNPRGNVFVQYCDPSQKSKQNCFQICWEKVKRDAVKYLISKESYVKFVERVEKTLLCYAIMP